jgi:hypothetical protein
MCVCVCGNGGYTAANFAGPNPNHLQLQSQQRFTHRASWHLGCGAGLDLRPRSNALRMVVVVAARVGIIRFDCVHADGAGVILTEVDHMDFHRVITAVVIRVIATTAQA